VAKFVSYCIRFVERVKVNEKSGSTPGKLRVVVLYHDTRFQFLLVLRIKLSNVASEGYFRTTSLGLFHVDAIEVI